MKKSEKGSISLYVLIACTFFVTILAAQYIRILGKSQAIEEEVAQIQENYKKVRILVTNLKVDPTSKTLIVGQELKINETVSPEDTTEKLEWSSSNDNVATVDQTGLVKAIGMGTATITVKASISGIYASCTVEVILNAPKNPNLEEDVPFSTDYGKIDVIWLDTDNNVISSPNKPIITDSNGESLTPIKWSANSGTEASNIIETTSSDSDWYNYSESRWANVKAKNASYFVWIPRYAYRIIYYSDSNYETATGYYDGYGQWKITGELRLKIDEGIETVDYNDFKYIVHPAFETNLDNGGWSNELSGFWVAKFLAHTSTDDATGVLNFQAGEWVPYIQAGSQYKVSRNATYGYTGTIDSFDGKTSFMYSHMMKNSEWGAIVYLAYSKYGSNGIDVSPNHVSASQWFVDYSVTGGGASFYNRPELSSTQNVYGVYDLVGGLSERTATINISDDNNYYSSSGWQTATGLSTKSQSTKYVTMYKNSSSTSTGNSILYSIGKVGDATKEVNTGGQDSKTSTKSYSNWIGKEMYIINSKQPFFGRGGYFGASENELGIFAVGVNTGGDQWGFRAVLCP